MWNRLVFATCLAANACRLGGPSGDPSVPTDTRVADSSQEKSRSSDATGEGAEAALLMSSANDGADLGTDVGPDAAEASVGAVAPPGDGGCLPAFTSAVCDPVCNTNCALLERCNVSNTTGTGICVGIWISAEGATCVSTATTDPCAPMLTCLNGVCRRLCYRNADCTTAGTCCNTSIDISGAPSGFKACTSCP